jgi:hypothetical protein
MAAESIAARANVPRLNITGCTNDLGDIVRPLIPMMMPNEPPAINDINEDFCSKHSHGHARLHSGYTGTKVMSEDGTLKYANAPPMMSVAAQPKVTRLTTCDERAGIEESAANRRRKRVKTQESLQASRTTTSTGETPTKTKIPCSR